MTADVSILVAERHAVLKIPNPALRFTPSENARFSHFPPRQLPRSEQLVYGLKPDGKTLDPVIVRVGVTDGVDTEAISGVGEGTRLVTATRSSVAPLNAFGQPPPPQM